MRQGDLLASLLFCLAVAGVYRTAAAAGQGVQVAAFMDDGHFIGQPSEVMKTVQVLEAEAAKIGLKLCKPKSKFITFMSKDQVPADVLTKLQEDDVDVYTKENLQAAGEDAAAPEIARSPRCTTFG